ncbi:MAG: hypothetical protein JW987_12275 [Anaerolineaceae bacterium]|nr:hypothetical protein [Anaerolineaceae bacterium]
MTLDDILKIAITTLISALVTGLVDRLIKQSSTKLRIPWLSWIISGFLGGAIGGLLSGLVIVIFGGTVSPKGVATFNLVVYGSIIGFTEWLVLRSYRPVNMWFVVASAIGWSINALFNNSLLGWFAVGLAVGIMQFFSLSKYQNAYWWIIANPIIWLIATTMGILIAGPVSETNQSWGWIFGWAIVGLIGFALLLIPLSFLKEKAFTA